MDQKCKFSKERDLLETVPDLAIDIAEALATGIVKDVPVPIEQYNLLDSTDKVGRIVRDPFQAIDAAAQIRASLESTE